MSSSSLISLFHRPSSFGSRVITLSYAFWVHWPSYSIRNVSFTLSPASLSLTFTDSKSNYFVKRFVSYYVLSIGRAWNAASRLCIFCSKMVSSEANVFEFSFRQVLIKSWSTCIKFSDDGKAPKSISYVTFGNLVITVLSTKLMWWCMFGFRLASKIGWFFWTASLLLVC